MPKDMNFDPQYL